jgi:hypothetical protein
VAVIHQAELKGVGRVADLTSSVTGKVELVWRGANIPDAIKSLGGEGSVIGDTVRVIVSESNQDAVLEALRREHLRLVSVTPLRTSLEDYFVSKLNPTEIAAGAN